MNFENVNKEDFEKDKIELSEKLRSFYKKYCNVCYFSCPDDCVF